MLYSWKVIKSSRQSQARNKSWFPSGIPVCRNIWCFAASIIQLRFISIRKYLVPTMPNGNFTYMWTGSITCPSASSENEIRSGMDGQLLCQWRVWLKIQNLKIASNWLVSDLVKWNFLFSLSSESRLPNAIVSLYYATAFDVVFKFSCVNCLFRRIAVSTPVMRIYNVAAVMAGDAFRQKSSGRRFPPNYPKIPKTVYQVRGISGARAPGWSELQVKWNFGFKLK